MGINTSLQGSSQYDLPPGKQPGQSGQSGQSGPPGQATESSSGSGTIATGTGQGQAAQGTSSSTSVTQGTGTSSSSSSASNIAAINAAGLTDTTSSDPTVGLAALVGGGGINSSNPVAASTPILPSPGHYNAASAVAQVKGNPWFSSFFLTVMTMNMTKLIQTQEKMKSLASQFTKQQMKATYTLAQDLGNLISQKAQLEANQCMALIGVSLASFAVGAAGFCCSMSGIGKKLEAKMSPEEGEAVAGGTSEVGEEEAGENVQEKDAIKKQNKKVTFSDDTKTTDGSDDEGTVTNESQIKKQAAAKEKKQSEIDNESGKPDAKRVKTKAELKAEAERLSTIGDFLQRTLSHTMDSVLSNAIQASFKMTIARQEQLMELKKATQQINQKAMDNASQMYNGASSVIDQTTQFEQQTFNAMFQANSVKG